MNIYPSIKQVFRIFGYLIVLTLLISISLELINKYTFKLSNSIISLISYSIPLILTSIRYLKIRKNNNQDDYIVKHERVDFSLLFLLLVFLALIIIVIEPIDNLLPVPDWFNDIMSKVISRDIYSFISVVIMAPVLEELIVRGVILDGLLKRYNPLKAILLSSLIFGLMHLNPWQFLSAFIAGLYLGWIYYRIKSIIPCIMIHSVNNLIAFLMFAYFPNSTLINLVGGNKLYYYFVILISLTLLISGIWTLNKKIKSTHNTVYTK